MLNIISRSVVSDEISGPKKVVENLIKGLDLLGYPYCINRDLKATSQLWIHDDKKALIEASKLNLDAIVGPNIYILPRNISLNLNLANFVYIHPSKWAEDFWKDFGFDRCKLDYWPTGIDTNEFNERNLPADGKVLIYLKQRSIVELEYIENILRNKNIKYEIIIYGKYKQKDYLSKLKNSRYLIWLGRQESQGIALEEALSMNVPILVWDVLNIGHWVPPKREGEIFTDSELAYENTTSAYYFDERCGIKVKDKNEIFKGIEEMEKSWRLFQPREFILENLNLEKQARDFIELFNKYYNISYADGKSEQIRSNKKWVNGKISFKLSIKIKTLVKKCVKLLKK